MVYFEKSQPAPACLEAEKLKVNGDYKCGEVLTRLLGDFKNKCYLCEQKAPTTINVEHFTAHQGDRELKFDWNNLFWSCGHCNNTKLAQHTDLLNCTVATDAVETALKYEIKPFPKEKAQITAQNTDPRTARTRDLLLAIFNGSTPLKTIESANLRDLLLQEIKVFQSALIAYYESNSEAEHDEHRQKITRHLDKSSHFTAFKRWIIRDNEELNGDFGHLLD